MIPAPTWTPSPEVYHSDTGRWSSTMVKEFADRPGLAFQMYVQNQEAKPKISAALITGGIVNMLVLDPVATTGQVHVVTKGKRSSQTFVDAHAAFSGQKLVITKSEWDHGRRVADSILEPRTKAAKVARSLLTAPGGFSEYAHRWEDPLGVPCRTMIDRVGMIQDYPTIVELKTSRDPSPEGFCGKFEIVRGEMIIEINRRGQAWQMGYHRQAGFNSRGLREAMGLDAPLPAYYFVVVRNEAPYEVAVYRASESFLGEGIAETETAMRQLAACLQDATGATWAKPYELLSDDSIPTINAPYSG